MNHFVYSPQGYAMTRAFEGLSLAAYRDVVGIWTIGYGHTGPDVHGGLTITEAQADLLLESDLAAAVIGVNRSVTGKIEQHHFDALVDFSFNLGCACLLHSTLLRLVNAGDLAAATGQFLLWDHAGEVVVPGLLRRRQAEMTLFAGTCAKGGLHLQPAPAAAQKS